MSIGLGVRLDGPDGSADISGRIGGLKFGSVAPGGFASVELTLSRPLSTSDLHPFSRLVVFDTETGRQVGGGRLLEPGKTVDASSGQVAQITALGEGLAATQDVTAPYFLIDLGFDQWVQIDRNRKAISASSGQAPKGGNDNDALVMQMENGGFSANVGIVMAHRGPALCGMQLGGFSFRHDSGMVASSAWRIRGRAYSTGYGSSQITTDDGLTNTMSARRYSSVTRDFIASRTVAAVHWFNGSSGTADDNTWSAMYYPCVLAQRLTRQRDPYVTASAYDVTEVYAHDAFIDSLARFCPSLDIENARVDTATLPLQQLAWYDGINAMGVMDDVLAQDAAFTWAAWELQDNGLHAVEFRAHDQDVRYELTVDGGFSQPAPSTEVYDAVVVRGKSQNGRDNSVTVTRDNALLDEVGLHRTATIDMGSETFSTTAATQAGNAFLDEHVNPPNAGTVTVAQRVWDHVERRYVKPFEIRPGWNARVFGVQPKRDTLNSGAQDGSTIFRIVSMNFDTNDGVAVCELDTPELTQMRAIARLARSRTRRA